VQKSRRPGNDVFARGVPAEGGSGGTRSEKGRKKCIRLMLTLGGFRTKMTWLGGRNEGKPANVRNSWFGSTGGP